MPRKRKKKLTPEQRKFLRTQLGPAIGRTTLDLVFNLPGLVQREVAAGPGEIEKLDPFAFVGLAFAAFSIGIDIRQGVLAGDDAETIVNEVMATLREPLNDVLAGLGANVGPVVFKITEAVLEAFKKHGLWEALDAAEEVFG